MSDMDVNVSARADQLADLMEEFKLDEAKMEGNDWKVAFRKKPRASRSFAAAPTAAPATDTAHTTNDEEPAVQPVSGPTGMPVSSPMTGIYYAFPNPTSPPFVREGEVVTVGQVVGLIEAMKVFNEIVAPVAGIVTKVVAKNGEVVNPGEPLLYIG